MVPHSAVNEESFFTVSSSGVTKFDSGKAEFTQLDQWQREYYLFNEILQIKCFKTYRFWKTWKIWKKFVRTTKVAASSKVLQKHLFTLNDVFQKAILRIRTDGSAIADGEDRLKLFSLEHHNVYKLEEFVVAQEEQAQSVMEVLKGFHGKALSSVTEACESTLAALQAKLFQPSEEGAQAGDVTAAPDQGKFSYTVLAQQRAEHRKLHRFIRLTDYMITDILHGLVVDSAAEVLDFVTLERREDDLLELEAAIDKEDSVHSDDGSDNEEEEEKKPKVVEPPMVNADGQRMDTPLFEIEVYDEDGELQFYPAGEEVHHEMEKMMESFVMTVGSLPSLSSDNSLLAFTSLVEKEEVNEDALHEIVQGDALFKQLTVSVRAALTDAFDRSEECKMIFEPFLTMVLENNEVDIQDVKQQARCGQKSLEDFREDMAEYNDQKKRIDKLPLEAYLGLVQLNSMALREKFLPAPAKCLAEIEQLLPELGQEKVAKLVKQINDANSVLHSKVSNPEEFCTFLEFVEELQSRQDELQDAYMHIDDHYELMEDQGVYVPPTQLAMFQSLEIEYSNMKSALDLTESRKQEEIMQFNVMVEANIKMLQEDRKAARNAALDELFLEYNPAGMNVDSEVIMKLTELEATANELKEQAEKIQKQQKLFNKHDPNSSGNVERFDELKEVVDDITLKKKLWDALREFGALTEQWTTTKFDDLDFENMQDEVTGYNKISMSAERTLPANNVVPELKVMVKTFKNTVPIIGDLRNDALKERHWEKIERIIGNPIPRDKPEEFTFGTLVELKVMHFKEQISVISTEATQEGLLESMLAEVVNIWTQAEFLLAPYKDQKDVYVLAGIDDIMLLLDDSMVKMGTITASRFVGGIRDKVEQMEKGLILFGENLDEALNVQRNWMYLESIFCAQDIQRQLPGESKSFFDVDATYKAIIKTTKDTGNAFKSFSSPSLLTKLQKAGATLDKIQNSLEDYLEKKKMAFPRFYFLSNDELLEILSQTRDPKAVQPHMGKCFDGIKRLDFGGGAVDRPETADFRIYGIVSPEGEVVDYEKKTAARGNVEAWLTGVENEMRSSLKTYMKAAVKDYPTKPREDWIDDHVCQVVLTVAPMYWATEILAAYDADDTATLMKENLERSKSQLFMLTQRVRETLTKLQRKVVSTLITLDVHNRDIISEFIRDEIFSVTDFGWQMQLRFYWDEEADNCIVRQTNASFWYGYEYLGAQMRLVVTPMTDRCYMTLSGALHLKLGGAPAGPAGTGKTETTKDLSKGLGIQCVVFNCGDNLDYKFMGTFFKGLCQCGAWACFDEFNRIGIEVLSVVAQQMISIQNGLRSIPKGQTQSTFNFEGVEIRIIETFGAFITMNPGYAGRTELPDNLEVRQCTVLGLGGVTISNSIALTHPVPQPEGALPAGRHDDPELHHGRRGHALLRGLHQRQGPLGQVHQALQALVRAALPAEALRLRHARRQVRAGHGRRAAPRQPRPEGGRDPDPGDA